MISAVMFGGAVLVTGTTLVAALDFSLSQQRVKLGTTGTLTMTCDVTEIDVAVIYNIQIRRETEPGSNYTWEILAEIEAGEAETPALDEDIVNDKDFVAGGIFDKDNPVNTYLTLDMNTEKVTYNDTRAYRCQLTYKRNITESVSIVKRDVTLSVYGAEDNDKGQSDTRQCSGYVNKTTLVTVGAVLGVTNILTVGFAGYVTVMMKRSQERQSFDDKNRQPGREELLKKHDGQETDDVSQ